MTWRNPHLVLLLPAPQHAHQHSPIKCEAHPGRIAMESQRVRRLKKQIQADEAQKKAATSAASRRAEEEHQRVLWQLKESEDAVEREEEAVREHTARPDLWYESLQCQRVDVFTHPLAGVRDTRHLVDTNMDCEIKGIHGKHWSVASIQNGR